MKTILVVDDEDKLLEVLQVALENMGYSVRVAESAEKALSILEGEETMHLVLSDLRLPGLDGSQLLQKVKEMRPGLPVVIMTAYASLSDAVQIIKKGAFDYIVKPFNLEDLEATVASALRFSQLADDNKKLRETLKSTFDGRKIVGNSAAIHAVRKNIAIVSASEANVLITGESGTGKELVAKAIHYNSPRASGPLVIINCAAIPDTLLESELFGHKKGAFTGASSSRIGRFAQADSGSIFLDEIGDMPLALQAKVLRCIQEKTIEPVGDSTPQKVDVRIIAATNHNLETAIHNGSFRQDLYYRLNVYPITLPPLRDRKEDIPLLARHFAEKAAIDTNGPPVSFSPGAALTMREYAWPGNIRELRNLVERLTIIYPGQTILGPEVAQSLTPSQLSSAQPGMVDTETIQYPIDLAAEMDALERKLIIGALEQSDGVQVKAAELLGISERSIWHKVKKLNIQINTTKHVSS